MNRLLGICALVLLFGLPAFSQGQRMSPNDQDQFNNYYSRWMQDRQRNDRDDMISMEHHMQDLMNRYAIPPDTPYGEVAAANAGPGYDRDRDRDRDYRDRSYAGSYNQLSPDDQKKFNDEYGKWQKSTAKNDRDDIDKHARKMEDIMARYNIPPNTPFEEIASANGYAPRYNYRDFQGRLSPDDQQKFDKSYRHWLHERSENDRGGMAKEEGHMQEIMARYNIPRDVPYDVLASGGGRY